MKENMSALNSKKSLMQWYPLSPVIEKDKVSEAAPEITESKKLLKGESANFVKAIQFIFEHKLSSPERKDWKSQNVIFKIMDSLGMPAGCRNSVTKVLD